MHDRCDVRVLRVSRASAHLCHKKAAPLDSLLNYGPRQYAGETGPNTLYRRFHEGVNSQLVTNLLRIVSCDKV